MIKSLWNWHNITGDKQGMSIGEESEGKKHERSILPIQNCRSNL